MNKPGWCIKCSGSLKYDSIDDEMYCLNCGWRQLTPHPLPLARIEPHEGGKFLDMRDSYAKADKQGVAE